MNRVGLFFGSFNPIHKAHVNIAQFVLDRKLVDEVWMIVSPQNPFKAEHQLVDFHHRFNMAKLATSDCSGIIVSDVEEGLPKPSYTIDTLQLLSRQYPETKFFLLIGGDNLQGFPKWKESELILSEYTVLCYSRAGSEGARLEHHPSVTILDGPLFGESATAVRSAVSDEFRMKELLHPSVHSYIKGHSLFE